MWAQTQLDMAVAPVHLANAIVALAQPSALIPPHQHPVTMWLFCFEGLPVEEEKTAYNDRRIPNGAW